MTEQNDTVAPGVRLLQQAIVWDNHGCMPLRADASFLPQLERYRDAGVTAISLNIGYANMDWTEHLRVLSFMRNWIAERPNHYLLAANASDIERAKREGKLAIIFDVEGMRVLEEQVHLVQTFYELGVRWMLVAYNRNNRAGGGCLDDDIGLTATGRSIIDEMERVGMVLCLSHAGVRTVRDALEYARNPSIFSHSNPASLVPHVRNVADETMRLCASKGGVVGLSGIGLFLGTSRHLVATLLDQLRYVIDLVGPEHVALGLDYVFDTQELDAHIRANPSDYSDAVNGGLAMVPPEAIPEIADGLARANLSDGDILRILGGNWLRIAHQVWK